MNELRFKVELNRGRHGIAIGKFGAVLAETRTFLELLTRDIGVSAKTGAWLAENFENNSVDFDCRLATALPVDVVDRGHHALTMLFADRFDDSMLAVQITLPTRRQFARIAGAIDPDEVIRFGLYSDGRIRPDDWYELRRDRLVEVEAAVSQARQSYGEVQGVVHAFFKEAERPYLKVRELSTKQLVNCYFPLAMYHEAVEVLADPDAVVFVEGWVTEDPETGFVTDMEVEDFRPAPPFSVENYRRTLGSMPAYTSRKPTGQFIDEVRDDG
jgi:hypothetical protein